MNFIAVLKIGIALLLLACLFDMPYGYYQLVRFISCIGFGFIAYQEYTDNRKNEAIVYALLGLLFQPLVKISLGRDLWNIIDVIVAFYLIVKSIKLNKKK